MMGQKDENIRLDVRNTAESRVEAVKLDTKCLYAGKLERVRQWQENPHGHPFCEILFVLSGSGITTIDGKTYNITKGDIIVYNPYTVHWEATADNAGIEMAFFGITNFQAANLPTDYLIAEGASPVLHTKKQENRFAFYFRSLVEEISGEQQYGELMAKYWARLILISILRLANISEAKFVTNAIFTKIHQYLTNHYTEIESMDQVCEVLGVSKYYLSHVFKNYMGVPPMQYVTSQRMAYAKKLLCETDLSASAIGEQCGYKDHSLFFKTFKKVVGVTPMIFREKANRSWMNSKEELEEMRKKQ
ncbi:MAG: helix-turn-helix domain-containing protein [Ruminococcaceae bacterium]|nr:helix-turn-helix domain-containing protein [Oscillospiraceae bacterium]